MLSSRLLIGLTVLAAAGCTGSLSEKSDDKDSDKPGLAFDAERDRIELLPFPVRLRRVADVVGLAQEDILLGSLRDRSAELGHHDFAIGVRQTPAWDAPRVAAWSSALLPVCESQPMRKRYPAFPDALDDLISAAYGRKPSVEEVQDLWAAASASGVPEDRAYVATCLAVLSSLEFVAR